MSLNVYIEKFSNLKAHSKNNRTSPHKICMLLAVLDLARSGGLNENKIYFTNIDLRQRYTQYFKAVAGPTDKPNPHYPFFYLRGRLANNQCSFWQLVPRYGRQEQLDNLVNLTMASQLDKNVAYATLDDELFNFLQNRDAIEALSEALAEKWFHRGLEELRKIAESTKQISDYEYRLRTLSPLSSTEANPPERVRSPAFRRLVTEIYDYRCAATGQRIVLEETGEAMVEAAHIHPFSKFGDDDPRNGLALNPNMHWAMDKGLIAPGPDLKWHVSEVLDKRIVDFNHLWALHGQPLLPPKEKRFTPKEESLIWRLSNLRKK
jgi:putative restriction endonuclease